MDRWQANLAVLEEMLRCVSAGDMAGQLAHVADDIVYEAPYYAGFGLKRGRDALAAMLAAVEERFSSIHYEVVASYPTTDPDTVIAEVRGDHQVKGADRRYQNHYVMFLRFRDAKVAEWREFSNPDIYRAAMG
ncbi:MAG: nuclear transport factor 2 family protein [Acidimicrobiales bacterium]